ncbi:hypothetical protein D3C87_1635300 [compost metagenome]
MAMNYLTVYDPETGKILETHASPGKMAIVGNKAFVELRADRDSQYVKDGLVLDRPTLDARLTGNIITGAPAGASIFIDGTEYTADGSDIELSFSIEAKHVITIELWPHLPMELVYEN